MCDQHDGEYYRARITVSIHLNYKSCTNAVLNTRKLLACNDLQMLAVFCNLFVMSTEKTVSVEEFENFASALRALADASDDAIKRMKQAKIKEVPSTNYQTAVRGFGYVINCINDIAGTATTATAREQLAPVRQELEKLESMKKQAKNASEIVKRGPGRPKKES